MNLVDLDAATRAHIRAEVEQDITAGTLYLSDRLNGAGVREYPACSWRPWRAELRAAFASGHPIRGLLNLAETAIKGRPPAVVPPEAADALAEGEFNRFYMRGVCARAIAAAAQSVQVYQAQTTKSPLPESAAMIGLRLDAQGLLDDLRSHTDVDQALGLPSRGRLWAERLVSRPRLTSSKALVRKT